MVGIVIQSKSFLYALNLSRQQMRAKILPKTGRKTSKPCCARRVVLGVRGNRNPRAFLVLFPLKKNRSFDSFEKELTEPPCDIFFRLFFLWHGENLFGAAEFHNFAVEEKCGFVRNTRGLLHVMRYYYYSIFFL